MAINKERLAKGIEALRSGEFPQCHKSLREVVRSVDTEGNMDTKLGYCCLGVLTEVALRDGAPNIRRQKDDGDGQGHNWFEVFVPADLTHDCGSGDCGRRQDRWVMGSNGLLPLVIQEYYGFSSNDPVVKHPTAASEHITASGLNDVLRLPLDQIAQIFEDDFIKEEAQ